MNEELEKRVADIREECGNDLLMATFLELLLRTVDATPEETRVDTYAFFKELSGISRSAALAFSQGLNRAIEEVLGIRRENDNE